MTNETLIKKALAIGALATMVEIGIEEIVYLPFAKHKEEYVEHCISLRTSEENIGEGTMRYFTSYITPNGQKGQAIGFAYPGTEITVCKSYWEQKTPILFKILGASPTYKMGEIESIVDSCPNFKKNL
jgi:hypothetical protein